MQTQRRRERNKLCKIPAEALTFIMPLASISKVTSI